jgi:transcriptional regulator of acetoin/glycerol metabolism
MIRAVDKSVQDIQKTHLINVLRLTKGNKRQAAKMLSMSRGTLYRRLKEYGLEKLIRKPLDELDQY